jgi:PAS domain S-box-containing protein
MDINMPGLNGYETASIIKKDSTTNIPIIFLSANANKDSIRKAFEHGGEDYITKPFDELELIHRVKTHVDLFSAKENLLQEVNETKALLEQYKLAVDASAAVSKADLEGNIIYVNNRFCELTKYPRQELIGKNHRIFRSPDVSDEIYKSMWETITSKKTWNGLVKNVAKDGSNYYFESTIFPILNYSNEIIEYISIRTDITKEIELQNDIVATQEEVLHTLGELGEWRSKETGDHVNRVSLISELLAKAYGSTDEDVALLKMASPMHDIGKVMKNHTTFGWEIFNKSKHQLLQAAALISYQHHEKWDGTGYPRGLSGEEIHVFGRITAIADVFDALTNDRVYKKAWSIEDTIQYIISQKGTAFEPKLVDLLIKNLDEVLKIKQKYNK